MNIRFIVTKELGRLAKWLRIMGYDTDYFSKEQRTELIIKSLRENRVILTRNSRMARYTGVRIVHINSDFIEEQLRQIFSELGIRPVEDRLFSRCVICNVPIEKVEKGDIKDKVAPYVYQTQSLFMTCKRCGRIYWQGTHWAKVKEFLKSYG